MHYQGLVVLGRPGRLGAFARSLGITSHAAKSRRNKRNRESMSTHGKVVKWLDDRFFGFAKTDGDESVFVHGSELGGLKSLAIGTELEFNIVPDKRDPTRFRATGVTVL